MIVRSLHTRNTYRTILSLLTIIYLVAGCSHVEQDQIITFEGYTMGTSYGIQIIKQVNKDLNDHIAEDITTILNEVDHAMSTWKEDSELSNINNSPDQEWITISPDLLYVLDMAISVSKKTQGAFDITLAPLIDVWGFSSNEVITMLPDEAVIKNSMRRIGYQYLHLDKQKTAIRKEKEIKLNLSAIAKGFAVDKIASYLDKINIQSYLVEIGGEVRTKGVKSDGSNWRIAIETPSVGDRQPYRLIKLSNHAVATSGDYRNFYEIAGQRYSHIINPFSGYPVTHNLVSVTILEQSTAYADALATAIMVMGIDKGYQFCIQNKIPAYFIAKTNNGFTSRYTPYMEHYFID